MIPASLATLLFLLWLAGNGTRLTILAIPPIIPQVRMDLGLSETEVGIVSGLPAVLFAFAAVPGALLIARFGALQTLIFGLLVGAAAAALRAISPDVFILYLTTIGAALGVSVMHVALPPLVREWLPQRIPFATAVYTNGLLVGEILPVAMMLPIVMPLVGGSWRAGLVVWAVPLVLIAVALLAFAPRQQRTEGPATATPRRWWPDWHNGIIWRLGLMLGSINAIYFATNAFLPDYLHSLGRDDLITAALTALNLGQLPASLLLLAIAGRLQRRAWPYVAAAALSLIGFAGIFTGNGVWIVTGCTLLGFSAAGILVLMLALPPMLSAPEDVPRTTAAMFTISYSCAVIVPIISGFAWDMTHVPAVAFIPIALCPFVLAGFALTFDFRSEKGWYVARPI
ncbi:MAG: MFS transporter [Rhizobiales bacterium]|nr:MFS transporter [Hyphomicrobiales bacterium]